MPIFKQNLKELELPDFPDFKAKEKSPISKSVEKKELDEFVEKPKPVKKSFKITTSKENNIKPKHHFILKGGHIIKNMKELKEAIKFMDKDTFRYHVTKNKNDFAEWVKNIIKDKELSDRMKKSVNKEHILTELEFREKEKEIINKVNMLEEDLKEKNMLIIDKNDEIRKKQTQIDNLSKNQVLIQEDGIDENKAKLSLKKENKIEKKNEFLEKLISENKEIKSNLSSKERLVNNKDNELRRKEQDLLKKESLLEGKRKKFELRKEELEELGENQKEIEEDKEMLENKAKLFLKKEEEILEANALIQNLLEENNKRKDKLLSNEKNLIDRENEARKKEQEILERESLLKEKEMNALQILPQKKIKPSVNKSSKKEKIEEIKKKEPEKIKKIGKENIWVMIKEINDYVSRGNISGAKHALSRMREAYSNLNKKDRESLKYDLAALETDMKLASLNI